jgi:uncharacterized membrane protein YeiH
MLTCLILGLGTIILGIMTATSGGEIRHTEIRQSNNLVNQDAPGIIIDTQKNEDHD